MKRRRNIFVAVVLLLCALAALVFIPHYRAKARLEAYRQQLRAAGEKLEVNELAPQKPEGENGAMDFWAAASASADVGKAASAVSRMILPGKAQAGWQRKVATEEFGTLKITTNLWPILAAAISLKQGDLFALHEALHRPAFYFPLDYSKGAELLMPHLAFVRQGFQELESLFLFNMHEGKTNEAWDNLMDLTLLTQKSKGEPLFISQMTRIADFSMASQTVWAALEYHGWTDAQLETLQRDWEAMEMKPETADAVAMERAFSLERYADARISRAKFEDYVEVKKMGEIAEAVLTNPRNGWQAFLSRYPRYWMWQWVWSYDDEHWLTETWQLEKDQILAPHFLKSTRAEEEPDPKFPLSHGQTYSKYVKAAFRPLTQAQLVSTAIALERYRRHEGQYPASLNLLVPQFIKKMPLDYMDGQPLRYHRNTIGTFLLYSIGMDEKDDGGDSISPINRKPSFSNGRDWVWPQSATEDEVAVFENGQKKNIPPISVEEKYREVIHADQ